MAIGLIGALDARGDVVQPFKVGPDFLDPTHHRAACGRWSHNLDGWMLEAETNRALASRHASDASIAVVEGVMGLFDGVDGRSEAGSTAEMAKWLGLPVALVIDAWTMARSAAAMASGYADFDDGLEVSGVIFNRIAGEGHLDLLRDAVEASTELTVFGGIPKREDLEIPERHLGLHPASEGGLPDDYLEGWTETVAEHVDLDALIGEGTAELECDSPSERVPSPSRTSCNEPVRLGVAVDEAFCFYYRDNLARLESAGAEIVEFSPLAGTWPDSLDGLYIGGGYPELYAAQLEARAEVRDAIRSFAEAGGPIYAECGGLMFLADSLETVEGEHYEMCGVFPFSTRMRDHPIVDYAEVEATEDNPLFPAGECIRGHVFHQSERVADERGESETSYRIEPRRQSPLEEGWTRRRVLASYVHLHFGSNPAWADALVEACR